MNNTSDFVTQPSNITASVGRSNPYALMVPSLVTIALNLLSFGVVITNPQLQGRIKVCFLGHLLTDLGFGACNLDVAFRIYYFVQNSSSCYWSVLTYFGFCVVTSFMALLQTFDRFFMLRLTYSYGAWITAIKMAIIVVLIYVFSFLILSVCFYVGFQDESETRCIVLTSGGMIGYILCTVLFSISIVIVTSLYVYIAKVIRRHEEHIKMNSLPAESNNAGINGLLHDKKNVMTLAIIVFLYIVCYVPMTVTLIQIMFNWDNRVQYFDDLQPYHSGILLMANSIINPIVYIWRLKTNRDDCSRRMMACWKFCRRTREVGTTQSRQVAVSKEGTPSTISDCLPG